MKNLKIILFNPRAAEYGYRIPNSVLQVAASIEGKYDYVLVDGNREEDPWKKIKDYLDSGEYNIFGSTVMPGPQLKQAIPITKKISQEYPDVTIVWGGYFASNQHKSVMNSGFVDYIIDGPGDFAFPALLNALQTNASYEDIDNLIYKQDDKIVRNRKAALPEMDKLPFLPYKKLHQFYGLEGYLKRTFLGNKTIAYHSSFGCPFTCSFCAVVPVYNARWKGFGAQRVYDDVKKLIDNHKADAIEFHDNNFFVSEKRTVEFAKLISKEKVNWWGEARIDTMDQYKDESLQILADSGCKMIFFGAESGNDEVLKQMDKGGKQTAEQIISFAGRLKKFGIVPEYSFVLGTPADSPQKAMKQINEEIRFIKKIKKVNPDVEIIIYVYSPVPTEGSELFEQVKSAGFKFPEHLEDWLDPSWEKFDLRKNPLTPWLTPAMVDKIKNFETVINARYPTWTDRKLSKFQRKTMKAASMFRYRFNIFKYPYELKALQKYWLKYRRPETEGF